MTSNTNVFGGNWTQNKIEILVAYAKAYLRIMNKHATLYDWELLYFDGFAGSGFIEVNIEEQEEIQEVNQWHYLSFDEESNVEKEESNSRTKKEIQDVIIGAAKRILNIDKPRAFDMYYFVEKEITKFTALIESTQQQYPDKTIYVANDDCNSKILSLSKYLQSKGRKSKVLAYIDPCGMQVNWNSLSALAKQPVDAWILIPTGLGVNRLLKRNGEISEAWLLKLEKFLGMTRDNIMEYFYTENVQQTLFGPEKTLTKKEKAIERSATLYAERLNELFKFVSKPYVLKNHSNTIMFHFLLVSNNPTAVKIANEIVEKYN